MAFIIFYCDRREMQTLIWEEDSKRLRAPEGFSDGINLVLSNCVQILTLSKTQGSCQAVPNAPVSVALLPNAFCQKGSFLARCPEQNCCGTADLGRQSGEAQTKYSKELGLPKDTLALTSDTLSESRWQVIILR